MAVREALLALLADTPKHGYQLKQDFEDATGAAWPLNVGQVYTTLQRLERDGLVEVESTGSADDDGRRPYAIVDAGRQELERWLATPSAVPLTARDETTMRVLLALAIESGRATDLLVAQRQATTETLQTLTAMKADAGSSLAWRLQLDRMIFQAEAELRWLDLAETRLAAEPITKAPEPSEPEPNLDPTAETTSAP